MSLLIALAEDCTISAIEEAALDTLEEPRRALTRKVPRPRPHTSNKRHDYELHCLM